VSLVLPRLLVGINYVFFFFACFYYFSLSLSPCFWSGLAVRGLGGRRARPSFATQAGKKRISWLAAALMGAKTKKNNKGHFFFLLEEKKCECAWNLFLRCVCVCVCWCVFLLSPFVHGAIFGGETK
jgi:hypothetical protein